jgi:ABC-type uncharacterized transport system auxiliary subunit
MSLVLRTIERKFGLPMFNRLPRAGSAALIAISLLLLGIAGCGASRPIKYYQLTYPSVAPATQKPLDVTLLVRTFDSTALYKETRITYTVTPTQVGAYETHRWIAPPVELLQSALLRGLRSSGEFRSVMTVRGEGGGEYALNGYIYEFGEVDGADVLARLNYLVRLRDRKTGEVVWTHTYNHDEPAAEKTVPAVVIAMDKNVQRSVQEVNSALAEYFQTNPPK